MLASEKPPPVKLGDRLVLPSERESTHSSAAGSGAGLPVANSANTELSSAPATNKADNMASFRNT